MIAQESRTTVIVHGPDRHRAPLRGCRRGARGRIGLAMAGADGWGAKRRGRRGAKSSLRRRVEGVTRAKFGHAQTLRTKHPRARTAVADDVSHSDVGTGGGCSRGEHGLFDLADAREELVGDDSTLVGDLDQQASTVSWVRRAADPAAILESVERGGAAKSGSVPRSRMAGTNGGYLLRACMDAVRG